MLAALVALSAFATIGGVLLQVLGLSPRTYLSSMMFGNAGNVGIPVAVLAFGDEGMAFAIAFFIIVLTGLFTVGIALPQGKFSFRNLLRTPAIHAVFIGLRCCGQALINLVQQHGR